MRQFTTYFVSGIKNGLRYGPTLENGRDGRKYDADKPKKSNERLSIKYPEAKQ